MIRTKLTGPEGLTAVQRGVGGLYGGVPTLWRRLDWRTGRSGSLLHALNAFGGCSRHRGLRQRQTERNGSQKLSWIAWIAHDEGTVRSDSVGFQKTVWHVEC